LKYGSKSLLIGFGYIGAADDGGGTDGPRYVFMLGGFLMIVGLEDATGRRIILWAASAGTAKISIAAMARIAFIVPRLPKESRLPQPTLATDI
jgi:hypothetical protein